jgi:hypothetical protein
LPQAAKVKGGNAQRGHMRRQTCRVATICTCGAQKQEALPFFCVAAAWADDLQSKGAAKLMGDGFAVAPEDNFLPAPRPGRLLCGRSRPRRPANLLQIIRFQAKSESTPPHAAAAVCGHRDGERSIASRDTGHHAAVLGAHLRALTQWVFGIA